MYARIEAAAGGAITAHRVEKLGETGLRAIGVTRQKSAYLASLAADLNAGKVDFNRLATLPDDEAIAALDRGRRVLG